MIFTIYLNMNFEIGNNKDVSKCYFVPTVIKSPNSLF